MPLQARQEGEDNTGLQPISKSESQRDRRQKKTVYLSEPLRSDVGYLSEPQRSDAGYLRKPLRSDAGETRSIVLWNCCSRYHLSLGKLLKPPASVSLPTKSRQ